MRKDIRAHLTSPETHYLLHTRTYLQQARTPSLWVADNNIAGNALTHQHARGRPRALTSTHYYLLPDIPARLA